MKIIGVLFLGIFIINNSAYSEFVPFYEVINGFRIYKEIDALVSVYEDPYDEKSTELSIIDKRISTIKPYAFKNLKLKSLVITFRDEKLNLTQLSFQGLLFLESLTISSGIVHLEENLFLFTPALRNLSLRIDGLKQNFKKAFTEIRVLRNLKVFNSNLKNISMETFHDFGRGLYELDLTNNGIMTIGTYSFTFLNMLNSLKMDSNKLRNINPGTFHYGLDSLRHLSISSNELSEIKSGVFNRLIQLETINLENNNIKKIESGAFIGTKIETINLSKNNFTRVTRGIFNNLKTLKNIRLENNQIEKIENEAFSGLELEAIHLENNALIFIEGEEFAGLICRNVFLMKDRIVEIRLNQMIPFVVDIHRKFYNSTKLYVNYTADPIML